MPSGFAKFLVADYTFDRDAISGAGYRDRLGNASDLIWQHGASSMSGASASLDAEHWLKTNRPETALIQRIRQTSQFTLSLTLTPASTPEANIEHILSIADSSAGYNLAVGQFQTHLLVWLPTALNNGGQGIPSGFLVATFAENKPKRIVLSYAGSVLRLYASQPGDTSQPQQTFMVELVKSNDKVVALGLTFAPLGFLLSVIGGRLRKRWPIYVSVLLGGAIFFPLLRESLIAIVAMRRVSHSNSLLGLLVMLALLLLFSERSLLFGEYRTQQATLNQHN